MQRHGRGPKRKAKSSLRSGVKFWNSATADVRFASNQKRRIRGRCSPPVACGRTNVRRSPRIKQPLPPIKRPCPLERLVGGGKIPAAEERRVDGVENGKAK